MHYLSAEKEPFLFYHFLATRVFYAFFIRCIFYYFPRKFLRRYLRESSEIFEKSQPSLSLIASK